jgi:hypothetical protein
MSVRSAQKWAKRTTSQLEDSLEKQHTDLILEVEECLRTVFDETATH